MLNNLTNIFNLLKTRMVKTVLEANDLLVVGTRDQKYGGDYKPTVIKFSDLQTQLNAGAVESVTDDGNGVVSVDNTDPSNPIIEFDGVSVDGVTITGDGTSANPLEAALPAAINRGLYAQTSSSNPVTNTTTESSIVGGGIGSLAIPANGFSLGDSFNATLTGHISCLGSATLHIRIKTLGGVLLADTGVMDLTAATAKNWKLEVGFTVRAIGAAGVASISSGGLFSYTQNGGLNYEGIHFSTVNNTTFATTTPNILVITAEWNTASTSNSIYSDIFILNKTY